MSEIFNPDIMPENDYQSNVNQSYANPLPEILATEVFYEVEKRCGNGMQYTTFANTISDEEKAKLEAKGYVVTRNTVPSSDRYGQGDLYIGFQVALNARAAEEAMQITPNGGAPTPGTTDYTELSNKPVINGVTLNGSLSWADLGLTDPMHIAGRVDTVAELPQDATIGDLYLVGTVNETKKEYLYTSSGWEYLGEEQVIDSALSTTSENPVQNKVIALAIEDINTTIGNINAVLEEVL